MMNRLGVQTPERRALTPREKQQILRDYEALGPRTLARLLDRSTESIKQHWKRINSDYNDQVAA